MSPCKPNENLKTQKKLGTRCKRIYLKAKSLATWKPAETAFHATIFTATNAGLNRQSLSFVKVAPVESLAQLFREADFNRAITSNGR